MNDNKKPKKPKKDKRIKNNNKKIDLQAKIENDFTNNKEAVALLNTMIGLPPIENKELKNKK